MIKSFKHKGLDEFFHKGSKRGIQPKHADRLREILGILNAATNTKELNFPGSNLHPMHGPFAGNWAVSVSGSWRVIFQFINGDVYVVDYQQYH